MTSYQLSGQYALLYPIIGQLGIAISDPSVALPTANHPRRKFQLMAAWSMVAKHSPTASILWRDKMVCSRSARSSGQQVSQRRLSGEYTAGIEAKPKTPNNRSGQRCGNSCRTAFGVRRRAFQTSSNPYSDLSSCPLILLFLPINPPVHTCKDPLSSSVKCLIP